MVHEWLATDRADEDGAGEDSKAAGEAAPPLAVLAWLAGCALDQDTEQPTRAPGRWVAWVGRAVWPAPLALPASLVQRSLCVDAPRGAACVWAIEQCLRRDALVCCVVGDATDFSRACTQRLQLAAQARPVLVVLARPWSQRQALSAGATRWYVRPVPAQERSVAMALPGLIDARPAPCWRVECVRDKRAASLGAGRACGGTLRWNYATGALAVVDALGGGHGAASRDAPPADHRADDAPSVLPAPRRVAGGACPRGA